MADKRIEKREKASRAAQLNLFASPLGEFAKEALLLCLQLHPPGVSDLPFLQSITADLRNHNDPHQNKYSKVESASDIECLADAVDMINTVIDYYDDWRIGRRSSSSDAFPPLTRDEVCSLFEIRSIIRTLIIGLYK